MSNSQESCTPTKFFEGDTVSYKTINGEVTSTVTGSYESATGNKCVQLSNGLPILESALTLVRRADSDISRRKAERTGADLFDVHK